MGDYPFGATGFDPETGRYSWDEKPEPEDDEEFTDMARDL